MLVASCAVAGVGVLAGPGWALLAAAAALWVIPTPATVAGWVGRVGTRAWVVTATAGRWVAGSRRRVAIVTAPAAAVLAPVGVAMSLGAGAGLVAAGLVLGGMSMLTGWNA